MVEYRSSARRDAYGSQINRAHSPLVALVLPWASIIIGSMTVYLPLFPPLALLPPMGFMMLLGWRLVRPGLLPMWVGFPLGMIDDLFNGQPFGCAIMLWSLTLLALEIIETRFPWRGFLHDWLAAAIIIALYINASALFSGAPGLDSFLTVGPLTLLSILMFPIFARMVAFLDRLRLTRYRTLA